MTGEKVDAAGATDAAPRRYRAGTLLLPEHAPAGTTSVATIGDRIVAIGSDDECAAALPTDHEVVELGGATLAPGFVDAHVHPLVMCVFERQLVLGQVRSIADVLDAVADQAAGSPRDRAVIGFQLDDDLLAERRLPTAAELDHAGGGRPVVLIRRDGHHAVGSTSAFVAAGLAAAGSDPAGGRVERDASGQPTGLAREHAVAPLLSLLPDPDFDDLLAGLTSWSQRLLRQGVTSISAICQTTPEGPSGGAGALESVAWSVFVEQLPFDIQTILIAPELQALHDARDTPLHRPDLGRRVDAVKLFLDGTLGGRTACMHHPFSDDHSTSGMATIDESVAQQRVLDAHVEGLQVCLHAIGDRANDQALDLLENAIRRHPGPHRHRVEHASVLTPRAIERFAELGVTAVVQPISLRSEQRWLGSRLGDRLGRVYPFRDLLDAGATVAGSSDAPIEPTDVFAAMATAVDRPLAPEQAVTGAEALAMYTTGGAAARMTEDRLGRLAVGHRADLVVLSDDPTTCAPAAIADIDVLRTVVGGRTLFDRAGDPQFDHAGHPHRD